MGRDATASGAAEVSVSGGSIDERFTATGGAILEIAGGLVGGNLLAQYNTTVGISGTLDMSHSFRVATAGEQFSNHVPR